MQITVTIPDELVAEVQARGLTPESCVEKLIAENAALPHKNGDSSMRLMRLEKFFEELSARLTRHSHAKAFTAFSDEAAVRHRY